VLYDKRTKVLEMDVWKKWIANIGVRWTQSFMYENVVDYVFCFNVSKQMEFLAVNLYNRPQAPLSSLCLVTL
jgi:hypothetical protein